MKLVLFCLGVIGTSVFSVFAFEPLALMISITATVWSVSGWHSEGKARREGRKA